MDACGGCATKGDVRWRHATTGNATTSRRTRGKWEERRQRTRGDGASISRGCALRGGGRVKRMRGGGINVTTSHQTRDYHGGGKSDGNGNGDGNGDGDGDGDGDGECCMPPSRDLAATALVLAAEAVAALIADDADGGNSGVTIFGSASLAAGGGVIN